jgi:hypothetical protein
VGIVTRSCCWVCSSEFWCSQFAGPIDLSILHRRDLIQIWRSPSQIRLREVQAAELSRSDRYSIDEQKNKREGSGHSHKGSGHSHKGRGN